MSQLRAAWRRLPNSVRWGVSVFVCARIFFFVWGGVVMSLFPHDATDPMFQPLVPAPSGLLGWLLEPWIRWDVLWYNRIAVQGYGIADGRGAFTPLFPLLIGLAGRLLNNYHLGAFLVSDLACLGSLILLYEIAHRDGYDGRRTVVALLVFPFSFFLFLPYTETVLLLFTLLAFEAAHRGRWGLAGLASALAVLTKITAIVLLLPMAWELWEQRRQRPLWNGAWLLLVPLAAVGWVIARNLMLGVPLGPNPISLESLGTLLGSHDFQSTQASMVTMWPWEGLLVTAQAPFQIWPRPHALPAIVDVLLVGVVLYLTVLTFRLSRRSYALYTLALVIMSLVFIVRFLPLQDAPRRWMMAFPLFIAAATYVPARLGRWLIVIALLLQAFLSLLFVKWVVVG